MYNIYGGEKFFYTPSVKSSDAINVWFCFPAEYSIGMSALGYLHLFRLLDELPFVNIERIFSDSTKTCIYQNHLDLISFSFSFEFDFLNIFNMLKKYNIPFFTDERNENDPLIMGGGAVLTANSEPFYNIFDFIIIGDGEEIIVEIADVLYKNKTLSKKEKLEKLAQIDGCYVPSVMKFENVKRRIFKTTQCISSPIVTDNTAFSDTFLVEITRGCPFNCNFCMTSHINNPPHYADYNSIISSVDTGLEKCKNLGLLGALVPANPCFEKLCEYLINLRKNKEFKVSIGSLRADFITPLNVEMLTTCGQKSATIAVEAGSQKMRDFINKKLTNEQIFNAAKTCFDGGLDTLKLYAMVGFPNETDEDIDELLNLIKEIKQNKKIILSVNSFVPKKQTPFENCQMENSKSLQKKFNYLKKECHKLGISFRPCSISWNEIQGIISTGNRELAPSLFSAYENGATIGAFKKSIRKQIIN